MAKQLTLTTSEKWACEARGVDPDKYLSRLGQLMQHLHNGQRCSSAECSDAADARRVLLKDTVEGLRILSWD